MTRLKIYLFGLIVIAAFFCQPGWAETKPTLAKISHITLTKLAGVTRFAFEITGGTFRYQWKSFPDTQQLQLSINNTILATALPKSGLASTPVKDYQAKPAVGKSPLQLQFQLKEAVNIKVYTLPASDGHETRLVVDLKPLTTMASVSVTQAKSPQTPPKISQKASQKTPHSAPAVAAKAATKKLAVIAPEPVAATQEPLPEEQVNNKPKKTWAGKASNRPIMVVIDPGHGGKDSGAVGPGNTREKDVVLAISKLLQKTFKQQAGFDAELTRDRDIFIPLRQRLYIARRCKADIFVAIHADAAYQNQSAVGASVFALSERGATSEGARWLAQKENESELIHGVIVDKDQVLRSVLLDLSLTHTIAVSLEMGQSILGKLSAFTKLHYARVEQAAFVVLKSPDIPSLLVETGYISNPTQEVKLNDPAYQQQLANAIAQGVMAYFIQHPPGKA